MSLHIGAKGGDIAPSVLITGDPLRAKHYARDFLSKSFCYTRIRGMLGYTGLFGKTRISIQGTGIGIPSTALYIHELIHGYGVRRIIRVGTCGALQKDLQLGDLVVATEALTDSAAVGPFLATRNIFPIASQKPKSKKQKPKANNQPPTANRQLLQATQSAAKELNLSIKKGPLFSTDLFYSEDSSRYNTSTMQGVLGVDMETSILYAMSRWYGVQALSILTVSDNLLTGEEATPGEREKQANDMVRLALRVVESVSVDL